VEPEQAPTEVLATESVPEPVMVMDAEEVLPAELLPEAGAVVAVYMQKGGTGKTETVRGLIEKLAAYGLPVVGIDLDPHGALTAGLGIELVAAEENLANLLTGKWSGSIEKLLVKRAEHLYIVPSSVDMATVEQDLTSIRFREERLRKVIEPLLDRYIVVLDCPNNPGLLNDNALVAVSVEKGKEAGECPRGLVIVVQLEGSSVHSLELALDQIEALNSTRWTVTVLGWFANMVESQTRITKRTRDSLKQLPLGERLGEMPRRVALKDAWDGGKLLGEYDAQSDANLIQRQLAWNVLRTICA
jgi:chromosome partitioning protein